MKFFDYRRKKPKSGQNVLWIWSSAGLITAGDFYQGKPRDAAKNYKIPYVLPTHWCEWPKNWPR